MPVKTARLSGKVKALPAPELTVVPPLINTGEIRKGESINNDIELINSGDLDLRITEILTTQFCRVKVHLPDGKELEIPGGESKSTELLITPKNRQAMKVICTPDVAKGKFQGSITIKSNAKRAPVYVVNIRGLIKE